MYELSHLVQSEESRLAQDRKHFLKELPASTKCIDKYIRQTHCSRFYHILYFNFTNQHASSVGECLRPCRIGILLSVNSSLTNLGTYSQKPKTKTQLFFDKNNAL